MSNPTRTEAIKAFLMAFAPKDLAEAYSSNMEVQVTVAKDRGERVEGDFKGKHWHAYSDGSETWKPIRIPFNSNTEPFYEDRPMTYDLAIHAEGIGMTGWDWQNRMSRWVAFDFDAITGHSDKHSKKLSDAELEKIGSLVKEIPWVQLRKSTGGKGLHIYVYLEPIVTANHNEHAAVARAILSQISGIAGFDFSQKVDICGGNMWVWHRKLRQAPDGLTILKESTGKARIPNNWKDYTKVVSGRRTKNLPWFIEEQQGAHPDVEDIFMQLTGQRINTPLDSEHKRVMDWLRTNYPSAVWWDAEHHMLVSHTSLLKEAHEALGLRGPFETNAKGSEKGYDHNVFGFPLPRGGWALRRYTLGVSEHEFWEQDGAGWTRAFFNREADLPSACRIYEGIEKPSGAFWFHNAEMAQKAAAMIGADLMLPNWAVCKECIIKPHRSGRISVEVSKSNTDPAIPGWIAEKTKLTKMFNIKQPGPSEPQTIKLDDKVRHLVSESNGDLGWVVKSDNEWFEEPLVHVKEYLRSMGYEPKEISAILGSSIIEPWRVVNFPFQEPYPANRQWNRNAAQFAFEPSKDRDSLTYPTWLKVLQHLGIGLDEAVRGNEWAKQHGVLTGSDYLKIWIASLLREPKEPLPYLFFYSPEQNTGKTLFHEAISLLITKGVVRADTALVSQSNFNGELEFAILCVIEETDLRRNIMAYNRIKDWVTSKMLPIHKKQKQPYIVPNTTHWVQCANSHLACPVFSGDTRITMIRVEPIPESQIIPRRDIEIMLKSEAADFLAEILATEIPPSGDRLNLPIMITEDKAAAEVCNQNPMESFIQEKCYYAPGHLVLFGEFYDRFQEWCDPNLVMEWSKIKVGRELPPKFPKGRFGEGAKVHIGNMSWTPVDVSKAQRKVVLRGGLLFIVPLQREVVDANQSNLPRQLP